MTVRELTDAHLYGNWSADELAAVSGIEPTEINAILRSSVVDELAKDAVRQMEAATLTAALFDEAGILRAD